MSFPFRNIQTFIRNCIEPHAIALRQYLLANDQTIKKEINDRVTAEIEELKKLMESFKQDVNIDIGDMNDKIDNFSTISIGSILPWPSWTNPVDWNKWLECNGDIFNTTKYKDLAALLQSNTTPDYRGYFLRGVGGNSAPLGVHQGDRIRNITGSWASKPMNGMYGDFTSGAVYTQSYGSGAGSYDAGWSGEHLGFDASRAVPTGPENNPINKAVRYLIRALQ